MIEPFGTMENGDVVHRVAITDGDLSANVLTWGAVVQDLRMVGHPQPLVLGFDRFEPYPLHSPYFGAIAGRYANRIAEGKFTIDGSAYHTDLNFLGKHTLHGGSKGIGKRLWNLVDQQNDQVTLSMVDPDGTNGFPGNCTIECTYRIEAGLVVELNATCDQPTLCNLAHHSYFNLDGSPSILDHRLEIDGEYYLPVDDELIPTGEIAHVADTPFDFRQLRTVRNQGQEAYDHNFCLALQRRDLRQIARVSSDRSRLRMEILTTEPGLQFYSGAKLNVPAPGLEGRRYGPFAGMALEPQIWPDAPNRANFPSALLRPGERYSQHTVYRFIRED